ncbi:MAG: NAD-dependent epimerase/dehydratase family protein [Alphaproteobacteria bacterium]
MTILVTGVAGFIGYHVTERLLARGEAVLGIDNVNDYYDVRLKEARLARLAGRPGYQFLRLDIANHEAFAKAAASAGVKRVVHLAAQAGVRYSLTHPFAYVHANLTGHMSVLEACRHIRGFEHLVYASSSSVYGGNTKLPFAIEDRVDTPVSLYAATKRADELMSYCYSHLYGLPQTGLRFFTVYGPWGRPDMALYIFTRQILAGEPIQVFNRGDMKRDFTYIDDIVTGIVAALDNAPSAAGGQPPQRLYNIGNHQSEPLLRLISVLEDAIGRKAKIELAPMQPGDVKETFADISAIERDLGYRPTTPIDVGVPRFVSWYKSYHGV